MFLEVSIKPDTHRIALYGIQEVCSKWTPFADIWGWAIGESKRSIKK